jgi:DNA-binding NarL/FixJ family response regulator
MSRSVGSASGDHLARRSELAASRHGLPLLKDVLIVEDETFDADRLRATLRVLMGYDVEVRRATTLGTAIDAVIAKKPEIVFLDDYLKPNDSASQSIPYLRRAGYEGPIVVVSSEIDKQRRSELLAAGARDTIHKDHLDSVRVAEALVRVFKGSGQAKAPAVKKKTEG